MLGPLEMLRKYALLFASSIFRHSLLTRLRINSGVLHDVTCAFLYQTPSTLLHDSIPEGPGLLHKNFYWYQRSLKIWQAKVVFKLYFTEISRQRIFFKEQYKLLRCNCQYLLYQQMLSRFVLNDELFVI